MQALIGYDSRRRTLLIRDPYQRELTEFLVDEFFARYEFCGPRGFLMVPPERAEEVPISELTDSDAYEQLFRMQTHLAANERAHAQAVLDELTSAKPNHRLTIEARRSLAYFDADYATILQCTVQLLESFPDNPVLQLQQLHSLESLGRTTDYRQFLEELLERPNPHPVFQQYYAAQLIADARKHGHAFRLLRRVQRIAPSSPDTYHWAAGILWQKRSFSEAIHLNRIAACLDDKDERYARAYFASGRLVKSTKEVLNFLRSRVQRYGKRSSAPVQTLCWALLELNRTSEAYSTMEDALNYRPDDARLQLYAADMYARHGNFDAAQHLLDTAKKSAPAAMWLRANANIAMYRGDRASALNNWRKVLRNEPQAGDAHQMVMQLLVEVEGPLAAHEHLSATVTAWPHNFGLRQLFLHYLRQEDLCQAHTAAEDCLTSFPENPWVHRELATIKMQLGDVDGAVEKRATRDRTRAESARWILCTGLCVLLHRPSRPSQRGVSRGNREIGGQRVCHQLADVLLYISERSTEAAVIHR